MYLAIRVVKTSQILRVQRLSGYRVSLGDLPSTPFPESQGGRLFVHKENHHTLRLRDAINATSPTMKPRTVRDYHITSFYNYNLLTLKTLHANWRHLPRDWQWKLCDDHYQQPLRGYWVKKIQS